MRTTRKILMDVNTKITIPKTWVEFLKLQKSQVVYLELNEHGFIFSTEEIVDNEKLSE